MSLDGCYEHVMVNRRNFINADNVTRNRLVNEDIWVEYPLATKILANIRYMLQLPRKKQAPCLLIHSDAGMGKSALCERINHLFGFQAGGERCLASMLIRAKHVSGHRIFCDDVVNALTGGMYQHSRIDDQRLISALSSRNIAGIAFDEVNDLMLASRLDLAKNMKYIKELSCYPCCLLVIVIGTHDCSNAIDTDKQFSRRFLRIDLPAWRDEQVLRSFINAYVSTFPLRSPSVVGTRQIVKYLIQETDGVLDSIIKRLCNAAGWAILDGREMIDFEMIKRGGESPMLECS